MGTGKEAEEAVSNFLKSELTRRFQKSPYTLCDWKEKDGRVEGWKDGNEHFQSSALPAFHSLLPKFQEI